MANIGWGLISENIMVDNNGKPIIVGPLNSIGLPILPNYYTFYVNFSVVNLEHETEHKIFINVGEDNTGNIISDGWLTFTTEKSLPEYKGKLGTFMQNVQLANVKFKNPGIHYVEIFTNTSDEKFKIKFDVIEE